VAVVVSSRVDARRLHRLIMALVVVALVATGCGVPGSGDPQDLDDAPGLNGPAAPAENVELPVPTRESSPSDLVRNFLTIGAAADWSPNLRKEERVPAVRKYAQQFLSPQGKETWNPVGTSIDVIQVISVTQVRIDSVAVRYRKVGVLDGNGTLTPTVAAPAEERFDFQIFQPPAGETGPLLLNGAPNNLLPLSLDGLQRLFEVRPVYYWEPLNRFLVPDRRYLSKGISPEKRVQAIVERVLAGPSPFLSKAVLDPLAKAPRANAVLNGNNVVVDLPVSEQTGRVESLERLASQIRWSLHPNRYSVELLVEGRKGGTFSNSDYELDNPSQSPAASRNNGQRLYSNDQRLYAAIDGAVRPVQATQSPPSILSLPENANVVAAAVNTRQNSAALVRQVNGQRTLWVGRTPADGTAAKFRQVRFPRPVGVFSRPSYLPGAGDRVLVVADGALYDVDLGTAEALPVDPPATAGSPVAVSVAPDGARVAIVTGGNAYVTTIDPTKRPAVINTGATATLQEVYLGGLANLQGVGWFYEHQIAVGGTSGIMVAAIDGGALEQVGPDNLLGVSLTQLSAVPWNPIGGEGGNLVFEGSESSNAAAYVPYKTNLDPLRAPPLQGATPAPSASGTGTPAVRRVTAPFYADVL
jgi:hypothetical protein